MSSPARIPHDCLNPSRLKLDPNDPKTVTCVTCGDLWTTAQVQEELDRRQPEQKPSSLLDWVRAAGAVC